MFPYSFYRNNFATINRAIQKLEKNELTLEDILDEDDLVLEVKTNPQTQLASFFTNEVIRKLIDYSTKMPSEDDLKIGHKYPFNACEILCSDNSFILDKVIDNTKLANEDDDSDDSNIFKVKGKKLSEEDNLRKNSINSNESNSDNNSEDNEIIFFDPNKKAEGEKLKNDFNTDNLVLENKDIKLSPINDNENKIDNISENILKENTINKEDSESASIENHNDPQQENEKNLLEKNKDDELNFVNAPEESEDFNDNNNNNENSGNKASKENKENNRKVIFSKDTEDFNANTEEEHKSRNKKRGFHQKKKNLDNININMEKLISENKENSEAINNTETEDQEENNNNAKQSTESKENDLQEFIDLSDEKSKEQSCSSLNNSLKSEFATYSFPNLDHLFEFLDEGEELNYVLSGYFFKIFNHMLNCKKASLVKYIYMQNIYILDKLVKNVQKKSICDCLCKLLTMHIDEALVQNTSQIKTEITQKIFLRLREFDIEGLTNVSELIVECLKNKHFYFNFISDCKIFEIIKDLLINTNDSNYELNSLNDDADFPKVNKTEIYKNLLKILNKLNENILKDFGASIVTPSLNSESDVNVVNFQSINLDAGINGMIDEDLSTTKVEPDEIKTRLEKIYNILCEISYTIIDEYINSEKNEKENTTIVTTFDNNKRIVGVKRLLSVEYIKNILDITINSYVLSYNTRISQHIEKIIELNPFNLMIDHFFEFEFNSVFQKLFEQIVVLVSNLHTPTSLIDLLFVKCDFIKKFVDYSMNKYSFRFNSGKIINSGNFAACAEIINIVMKTENQHLKQILEKDLQFTKLYDLFYQPISSNYFKNLLYANKPAKMTYFDRINNFDEMEFDLDTPELVEEPKHNPTKMKSFILSCRDEFLYGKKSQKAFNEANTPSNWNKNIDENFNPLEYVSKGNLEEDDLGDDRNGELYVLENNDYNFNHEINGSLVDEENLFEIRNNGFIKNSAFNTDKEIDIAEVTSEIEKIKLANKIDANINFSDNETKEKEYNDLFFWSKSSKIAPTDLEFLSDL